MPKMLANGDMIAVFINGGFANAFDFVEVVNAGKRGYHFSVEDDVLGFFCPDAVKLGELGFGCGVDIDKFW